MNKVIQDGINETTVSVEISVPKIDTVSVMLAITEEAKKTLDVLDKDIPATIIVNDRMLREIPRAAEGFGITGTTGIQIIGRPNYPYGYFSALNRFGEVIPEKVLREKGFLNKK